MASLCPSDIFERERRSCLAAVSDGVPGGVPSPAAAGATLYLLLPVATIHLGAYLVVPPKLLGFGKRGQVHYAIFTPLGGPCPAAMHSLVVDLRFPTYPHETCSRLPRDNGRHVHTPRCTVSYTSVPHKYGLCIVTIPGVCGILGSSDRRTGGVRVYVVGE